jgi:hypothetical protein
MKNTKSSVYVETTIVSYLTARPSRDIVLAAHQQLTQEWWERRDNFQLFVSQAVITEASMGDADAARRRLLAIRSIPVLATSGEAADLAEHFLDVRAIPRKAAIDALHVAVAVVHGLDYVLTWNCVHIANAVIRNKLERACREQGYQPPIICTPEQLTTED